VSKVKSNGGGGSRVNKPGDFPKLTADRCDGA